MNSLQSIALTNVISFKDTTVDITDNNGLVVISGLNLDSTESHNTNGAGKSLLFSSLGNALFESTPLDGKLKKTHKEMLAVKGSGINLKFTSHTGTEVELNQSPSKYVLHLDGKDQKIGKKVIVQDKLKQLMPLTEDEFYSYCYIQSQRPLQFQVDKDLDRLKFITELFDLDVYDKIRQALTKRKGVISDKETEFNVYAGQYDNVTRELKKLNWTPESNGKLKKLKAKTVKHQESLKKLYSKAAKLRTSLESVAEIERIEKAISKLSLPSIDKVKLKKLIAKVKSYKEYKTRKSNYDSLVSTFQENIDSLLAALGDKDDISLKELRTRYDDLNTSISEIQTLVRKAQNLQGQIKEVSEDISDYESDLKELGFKLKDKIKSKGVDFEALTRCIELADTLAGHEDGDCPTCGSTIDRKAIEAAAKLARKKLTKHKTKLKAIKIQGYVKDLKKSLKSYESKLSTLLGDSDIKSLKSKAKSKEKSLDKIREHGIILKDLSSYREKLEGISKPKKVAKPKTDLSLSELKDQRDIWNTYDTLTGKLEVLTGSGKSFDVKSLKSELKSTEVKIEDLEKKLNTLSSRATTLSVNKKEYELHTTAKLDLDAKLAKIKPIIEEKELVTYLWKQFGATNLKLQAAGKMLKLLENSLNTYAPLVFSEPFKFSITPTKQGISAIVTRPKGIPCDIRKLSGAESNCFRLLFAVALMPLVPAHKRVNFIVLDEPDSACGEPVRQGLIRDFLPRLRAIVPHVFWITPKETDSFPECERWQVRKKAGISTIKKL